MTGYGAPRDRKTYPEPNSAMATNTYQSPLSSRYASKEMSYLFSNEMRFKTWRELWLSLAVAEKELGLPISDEAISQMRDHLVCISFSCTEYSKSTENFREGLNHH